MRQVIELETTVSTSKGAGAVATRNHLPILERDALHAADVIAVAEGEALALVVDGYYSKEACAKLTELLLRASDLWTGYPPEVGADHIHILGTPLYNCLGEEFSPDCTEYFEKAPARNRDLRNAVAPLIHPADRVRIELDNEWPAGATLLRIAGRPAFFGLCRFIRSGGGMEPHTDRADWDLPCDETSRIRSQLFLNAYLTQAAAGGDLELWSMEVRTQADYDALRSGETPYALDRALLPEPDATLSIEPGALVIANASRPHAVTPCEGGGERLSVSGFLGYSGPQEPLRVFS